MKIEQKIIIYESYEILCKRFYVKDEFHNNNENAINFSRILNIDIICNSIIIVYNKY